MSKNRKNAIKVLTLVIVGVVVLAVIISFIPFNMENRPMQTEEAEIAEKWMTVRRYRRGRSRVRHTYVVVFKFADGSKQEFQKNTKGVGIGDGTLYNYVEEGETGNLTYRVHKDGSRGRIVSFEKDAEFGGTLIEPYRRSDRDAKVRFVIIAALIVSGLFFSIVILALVPNEQ
jgi:hypothetical protein